MRRTVLIVDDDPEVHDLLRSAIDSAKYDVLSAYDGVEGLELARKNLPDLVLLDVDMPRMDGKQVLAEIRKDFQTASLLVVMLTAQATNDARVASFDLGVDAYLEKPFHVGTVVRRIDYLIDLRLTAAAATPNAPPLPPRR